MRKKIFTFLLALVAGAGTMFASDTSVDGIWYNFDGEHLTAEVTYRGDASEDFSDRYSGGVVIPSSVIYNAQTYTVTSIGEFAFLLCGSLTEITIPASVTTIGKDAFYDCSALTDVYCYPNAADLTWNEADCDDFQESKATNCHVLASQLSAYQTKFDGVVNVTFVGDLPAPTPVEPTYLDADFAINFMSNPYTVVGGGALPTGVEVAGDFHDGQHGYSSPVITIPVTAGNYLVKMGTCQHSNQDGSVKNEDGSMTYTTLATNTGVCYDANPSKNYVADIITIPSDQIIKVYGAQYTPYFSIQKMPEIPAFTDFELNFQTNPYSVSGTMPTGTNIAGTYHDNQHGYQNVEATIPMEAGTYRLTLGACQYGNGEGNVMSETNIELASFNQNLGENKCYHQNPSANIVSVTFTVDIDQNITINGGAYVPYMKLEAITSYQVSFALSDAEGTAPTAVDVTIGEDITMPVNKTMYKAGYTLTGWSDGVNTYPIGESFTPDNDVVLTPVFTANEADLLNASTDVTVKWYFGGDNGAPTTSYEGTSGLLVAQATIGDKTVDVKLSIDATSGKFAPQPDTEWAQVVVGTIFTYPYKEGMTVNVNNYKSKVTYYIADAEGKVTCVENDYYSFIEVTYPAAVDPTDIENVQTNHVQAIKFLRDGMLLIEKNGKFYNALGAEVK